MGWFTIKVCVSAALISFVSWLSVKKPGLAGLLLALPITTLLAFPFAFLEHHELEKTILALAVMSEAIHKLLFSHVLPTAMVMGLKSFKKIDNIRVPKRSCDPIYRYQANIPIRIKDPSNRSPGRLRFERKPFNWFFKLGEILMNPPCYSFQ